MKTSTTNLMFLTILIAIILTSALIVVYWETHPQQQPPIIHEHNYNYELHKQQIDVNGDKEMVCIGEVNSTKRECYVQKKNIEGAGQ